MTPGAQTVSRQQVFKPTVAVVSIDWHTKKSIQQYNVGSMKVLLVQFYGRKRYHPSICQAVRCLYHQQTLYMGFAVGVYDPLRRISNDFSDLGDPFFVFNQSYRDDDSCLR